MPTRTRQGATSTAWNASSASTAMAWKRTSRPTFTQNSSNKLSRFVPSHHPPPPIPPQPPHPTPAASQPLRLTVREYRVNLFSGNVPLLWRLPPCTSGNRYWRQGDGYRGNSHRQNHRIPRINDVTYTRMTAASIRGIVSNGGDYMGLLVVLFRSCC
jgi:hypothetical protein